MCDFSIKTNGEWLEGPAPRELALTNSFLSIIINEQIVTRLDKSSSNTTVNSVCLPLYPLAEWIALNWWRLLYECNQRQALQEYQYCHNLSYAGEGYFLPDLRLNPEIDVIKFRWDRRSINKGALSFIYQGVATISFETVVSELSRFVELVIERLQDNRIEDTPLQRDWQAIRKSDADPDEKQFCIACAQLGLDPYHISDKTAAEVIESYELLNRHISVDEFFNTVSPDRLKETAEWLNEILLQTSKQNKCTRFLLEARENLPKFSASHPWEQGYQEARWIRANFFKDSSSLDALRETIDTHSIKRQIPDNFCYALIKNSNKNIPSFVSMEKLSRFKNSFLQGRMFAEYLRLPESHINLVTNVYTPDQKRTRAFSAELFAPAESIRTDLKGKTTVSEEDISELADKYQISEFVIKHQIENHHIAAIA